jgi:hypothetical protein
MSSLLDSLPSDLHCEEEVDLPGIDSVLPITNIETCNYILHHVPYMWSGNVIGWRGQHFKVRMMMMFSRC